jgi:hypothetical protein
MADTQEAPRDPSGRLCQDLPKAAKGQRPRCYCGCRVFLQGTDDRRVWQCNGCGDYYAARAAGATGE